MTRLRLPVLVLLVSLTLAGCGTAGSDDLDATTPAGGDDAGTSTDPSPADDGDADVAPDDAAYSDSWLYTASQQFARSQDPEPTFVLTSETAVEFTFPDGSAHDTTPRSDCQIAVISIGEEYQLTMSYPDGSVLCSDIIG